MHSLLASRLLHMIAFYCRLSEKMMTPLIVCIYIYFTFSLMHHTAYLYRRRQLS
jgi:hypothetical protein